MPDAILREKQITKTSIIGILANLLLAGFKALIGIISGSIAITLDAVNNLTDAVSSVITILGIKLAKRKPDDKHPFGYGRIEYFGTILISVIILFAGVTALIESVKKILAPELPDYSLATVIIVVASVCAKLLLGRYVKKQGETYHSDSLIASGSEATLDAAVSAATLLGIVTAFLFHISIDAIIAAVIAVIIAKTGLEMFLGAVCDVIGNRPDSEITKDIKQTIREIDGVGGAYDLILHNYGPSSAIGSVHIEIPAGMTANEIHALTKRIQLTISEKFHVFLTVGIYAVDEKYSSDREQIQSIACAHAGVLGTHGVFIDEERKYASFDVLTDFTATDKDVLCREIAEAVSSSVLPGYTVDISLDTNYSD